MSNRFAGIFKSRKVNKRQAGDRPKEVQQILEEQIDASLQEFNRSNTGLFMSAFTAGLEIGFSILAISTVFTLFSGQLNPETLKVYLAICYSVGFIFVIIGRSELFTEHTALALLPVFSRSVSLKDLFLLWSIVYAGNLIGGFLFGFLLVNVGPQLGFIKQETFFYLAHELVKFDWNVTFLSAILAGWMMGLLGWLVTSAQETISRILMIILVTAIIGLAGLHHCIVGSIEVFAGMITSNEINLADYIKFQFWATFGNIIGGTVFVAVLKYSHVRLR